MGGGATIPANRQAAARRATRRTTRGRERAPRATDRLGLPPSSRLASTGRVPFPWFVPTSPPPASFPAGSDGIYRPLRGRAPGPCTDRPQGPPREPDPRDHRGHCGRWRPIAGPLSSSTAHPYLGRVPVPTFPFRRTAALPMSRPPLTIPQIAASASQSGWGWWEHRCDEPDRASCGTNWPMQAQDFKAPAGPGLPSPRQHGRRHLAGLRRREPWSGRAHAGNACMLWPPWTSLDDGSIHWSKALSGVDGGGNYLGIVGGG